VKSQNLESSFASDSETAGITIQAATAPKISIVTPSFNQGQFIEKTIRSVLDQNYPNLEYIVIDGGSTDGSVDIIRRYADRLTYWCSEPDQGQYYAINKGFAKSTGQIMAWLNSDDMYFPWAFRIVADFFTMFSDVSWITSLLPSNWNGSDVPFYVNMKPGFAREFFFRGYYMSNSRHFCRHSIQQESTFWTRELWESAGSHLDTTYKLAGDFELWSRFYMKTHLVGVQSLLGGFRLHGNQRSVLQRNAYFEEAERIFAKVGGRHCRGLDAWIRRSALPGRWPLNILPSLGFIQPASNIRWSISGQRWFKCTDYIT